MRIKYDQLFKATLGVLVRTVTRADTAREIPGHALVADLWVDIDAEPVSDDELNRLGLLGRMLARGSCLIEPFSQPPTITEVKTCILKQYSLDHDRTREAKREGRVPSATDTDYALPHLWIISTGSPDKVLNHFPFRPMPGWPEGFWERGEPDNLHIVVVRKLPKTTDSLFLRLLGHDRVRRNAIIELLKEPTLTWANELLDPVFFAFRHEFPQDHIKDDDMKALEHFEAVYAEMIRSTREEGYQAGFAARQAELEANQAELEAHQAALEANQAALAANEAALEEAKTSARLTVAEIEHKAREATRAAQEAKRDTERLAREKEEAEKAAQQAREEAEKAAQQAKEEAEKAVLYAQRAGLVQSIEALCDALDIELSAVRQAWLAGSEMPALEQMLASLRRDRRWRD